MMILGVGIHPFGRFPDRTYAEIAESAIRDALQDAGVGLDAVDAAVCARVYLPATSGSRILSRLTKRAFPVLDAEAACASGMTALSLAEGWIKSGAAECVLVFGVEKMPKGFMDPAAIYEGWQIAHGLAVNPMYWALDCRRYMHTYGLTEEQLARVAEKNHAHSVHNPNAMYRQSFSVEEILSSPLVCDPIRLLEICSPNEGAAAVLVSSERFARRHPGPHVKLRCSVHLTATEPQLRAPAAVLDQTFAERAVTRLASRRAYEQAGIAPEELDLLELQDADAFSEVKFYEELGLCGEGDAVGLIESGDTRIGGRIPVNVSGGLISKGEPIGASALGQVHEVVTQLRGRAGPRQVENAKAGMTHVVGAGGNCGIAILSV